HRVLRAGPRSATSPGDLRRRVVRHPDFTSSYSRADGTLLDLLHRSKPLRAVWISSLVAPPSPEIVTGVRAAATKAVTRRMILPTIARVSFANRMRTHHAKSWQYLSRFGAVGGPLCPVANPGCRRRRPARPPPLGDGPGAHRAGRTSSNHEPKHERCCRSNARVLRGDA